MAAAIRGAWRWALAALVLPTACSSNGTSLSLFSGSAGLTDLNPSTKLQDVNPKLERPPSACPGFGSKDPDPCKTTCETDSCGAGKYCDLSSQPTCTAALCTGGTGAGPTTVWKVAGIRWLPKQLGCDIDGDGNGDSAAGAWATAGLDAALENAIGKGQVLLGWQPTSPVDDGKPFAVGWIRGVQPKSAPVCDQLAPDADCPMLGSQLAWSVHAAGTCKPLATCTAAVKFGQLALKCPALKPFGLPVTASWWPNLYGATVHGPLPQADATTTLRLCGHWLANDIGNASIAAKGVVALTPDLDLDADGKLESISVAAEVDVVIGHVAGSAW